MSHWAKLDENNKVVNILVGNNDDPNGDEGYKLIADTFGGTWVKTSYNAAINGFRKKYACIGDEYSLELDAFIAPKPYPSWSFNETSCIWEAPTPMPTDDKLYVWNESTLSWVEVN